MFQAAGRAVRKFLVDVQKATTPRDFYLEELVLWDFTKEESLSNWDCISDKDIEGLSAAKLEPNGKGRQINYICDVFSCCFKYRDWCYVSWRSQY